MKNIFVFFVALLLMSSCTKRAAFEELKEPADIWNGYSRYLKVGEQIHTLWAGKNINVGTATYGIDDNANFYVTYDCSASGWRISESHMFAGDKKNMPLNKPGNPKIGQFPNSGYHSPWVYTLTYTVPLTLLPECDSPGFVIASHCIVHSPAGRTETAWAEGDFTFNDNGWGWFDVFFYNQPENPFTNLYGTTCTSDSLKLYLLNITTGSATLILQEFVGNIAGTYDGTAYDVESGMFFFVNYTTNELFVNQLNDEYPSFSAGELIGTAASGTFYNEAFYYVNADMNTINRVTFDSDWMIASETMLSTIPNAVTVNDIAMSPAGDYLYILGEVNGGGSELIALQVATNSYYTMSIAINDGAQIAYGSDGYLYAVAPMDDDSGGSSGYIVSTQDSTLTLIADEVIIIEDPFVDIATGPLM